MKILMIADIEDKLLWDYYDPKVTKDVDLVISCGDLSAAYLEFLVTMCGCPLLYVKGNHDRSYAQRPPEGCIPIDDKVFNYHGLRILGLGGSMRYLPDRDCMFSEDEMRRRIRKLTPKITLTGGFDLLVTHSPAKGYGDLEDLPHTGFACFNELMDRWKPAYMCFGHVHKNYGRDVGVDLEHPCGTHLINTYKRRIIEITPSEYPAEGKTGSALYDLFINLQHKNAGHAM